MSCDWFSKCTEFEKSATVSENIILVKCWAYGVEIYENVHAVFPITEEIKTRVNAYKQETKPLSVLLVGIDSISRLNFMRIMPKTHHYLEKNQWLNLKGYNKVADNTFPNLMALLTGMNDSYSYETCYPRKIGNLDKCDILWYRYRNLGYVTSYAEDEAVLSTFNYLKKGFVKPPTDFYFRPYIIAAEKLGVSWQHFMTYCTGPEPSGERILNLAKDFSSAFSGYPYFGFFWANTFSHDDINFASGMDSKVLQFIENIAAASVLNDSMVIFFSDHGFRFGEVRYTHTGWLEERLPFMYIWLPDWFKEQFPVEYKNFKINTERLTTPYDMYMTLQHVLVLAGRKYEIQLSNACPKCHSLFEEVDKDRSCDDAGIEPHWCTCKGHTYIDPEDPVVVAAAHFALGKVINVIESFTSEASKCAKLTLKRIRGAGIYTVHNTTVDVTTTYLLIILETSPVAVFEATVGFVTNSTNPEFSLQGNISRVDYYGHNRCVTDSVLQKYCNCYGIIPYIHSAFCHMFVCA